MMTAIEHMHPGPHGIQAKGSGGLLLPQHQALIDGSAIAPEVASQRGYWSATTKDQLAALGFPAYQCRVPALVNPVWNVFGEFDLYQARPDVPRLRKGKAIKYETMAGARIVIDVPPATRPHVGNPSIPLWITEGIRKADSGVSRGLAIIALLGVWNWRGTNSHGGTTALADWELIALNGRPVYIAFDSDVVSKPEVASALRGLGQFLTRRGANVRYIRLGAGPEATRA